MGFTPPPHPNIKLITNESKEWTEYEPPSQICNKNRHCNASMSANTHGDSK